MKRTTVTRIETLGQMLAYRLREWDVGVREAAKEIGVSPATVSRAARDKPVQMNHIIPIATWCKLTPRDLWGLLEAKKP